MTEKELITLTTTLFNGGSVFQMPRALVKGLLEAHSEAVGVALEAGEDVPITGLGKLKPSVRKAYLGRNLSTGLECEVAEKRVVRFRASAALKNSLNQ
jgi:DNA-binding protein HU-beta